MQFLDGAVEKAIRTRAGNPDTRDAEKALEESRKFFETKRDDVLSILRTSAASGRADTFLQKLIEEVEVIKIFTAADIVAAMRPSGQMMSRDAIAITQGLWTPPHILILADVYSIKSAKTACESLSTSVRRAFSHLERLEKKLAKASRIGYECVYWPWAVERMERLEGLHQRQNALALG